MGRIVTKNSNTAGTAPTGLVQGELAINVTDGKLYYGDGSTTKLLVTSGSGGGGGTGTVTSVQLANGTGISLSGTNPITTAGTITITNSAPDQTVTLGSGTGINVTGTYPSFTINSTISTSGFLTTSSFNNYTSSTTSQFAGTASFATTASYALNAGGTPGGSNTQIQFNANNAFSGSPNFTFNSGSNTLTLTGSLNITGSTTQIGNQTITGSILMSGSSFISGVDYIDFDTTASNAGAVARLKWNDTDGTLDLGLKGGNVTLQVGQEQLARVVNKTGTNLTEAGYQAVRVSGAQGGRLKVDLARGDNDGNSLDTLGLVTENIAVNQEGFVTISGLVRGINTTGNLQGETWADGDDIYVSPTTFGGVTNIPPTAPNHSVRLGYVVQSNASNGSIFVKVDNGYELGELHDVVDNSTTSSYGDLLVKSGSVWINSKQLTGSYGLTGSLIVTQNISASSFTGSLLGTASFATTASYALVSAGGGGGGGYTVVSVSSTPYNAAQTSGDIILLVDAATAGATTINLPTAVSNTAKFTVKKIDGGTNTVTVDANSTETIDGGATASILIPSASITLISNNSNWFII